MNAFEQTLQDHHQPLHRHQPSVLQLNLGKLCNLTCSHCHVDAGPKRKEIISRQDLERILRWFEATNIPSIDLTGGTPEMVPDFRYLVETVRGFAQPRKVMTRLNATIIEEDGYSWIPEFHAQHGIEVIASMPCYSAENVNAQRGDGVFDASIKAFQKLNALGYGVDSQLPLHFVYNPLGASLPPDQASLEADYKREMLQHFGIRFNRLFCLANMPIARFAAYLRHNGQFEDYSQLLQEAFNPQTVEGLMCRDTLNVSWLGEVYDCDFNQMLKLHHRNQDGQPLKVWELNLDDFAQRPIQTGRHCFGCTAGAGSSCGGALS